MQTLRESFEETSNIITVEDHCAEGELGEAVASAALRPPIVSLKKMPHSGPPRSLWPSKE